LLSVNSQDENKPELLDYATNYSAAVGAADGFIEYVWKGLSSDLEGRSSTYPDYNAIDADKAIELLTAQTTWSGGFEDVSS
jgi:hypothetical protein